MEVDILKRKGARKVEDVPEEVLQLLHKGTIETVNLTEWLAINHAKLIANNFEAMGISNEISSHIVQAVEVQKKPTAMKATKLVGTLLYKHFADYEERQLIFDKLRSHTSDAIRCYSPYIIALDNQLGIINQLDLIKPLVADHHFGVREVVWMAIRPQIDMHLKESIHFLSKWAEDEDENIRRFTTEVTRPQGVWCKHIELLKEQPELALPILEKLKSDSSKYVQDSVGNWLNDASKTAPEFVTSLCDRWLEKSSTKETAKIIKRARRTLDKK